ncbi:hypothetical protein [Micromonospora sp. HUAS LYJ1]|uniref:hypothetical protein n=1 Tax=Micromonospora sp. HUAS LYJ1 TaxID=3061626 RepID=UPI002673262B|nr:hypothetical protein [Micromonospora sp. HUAS LYJ1]WKU03733.1 hypothetical protein Q2K16_23255 [Micromonospora sp. HUAS LYJ1]
MADLTPAEARQHLATLMADLARDIDNSTLRGHFHNRGYPHLDEAALIALRRQIRDAVVTVGWPDQEDPAVTTQSQDRMPLRAELSTAGQLTQALEAIRELRIQLDRTEGESSASPGSGPTRAQGSPAGYEVVVTALHKDGLGALRSGDVAVSAVVDPADGPTAAAALSQVLRALGAPEPIRPADWEQRAIDAVREALEAPWSVLGTGRASEIAVRAIIDAGLVGPGGRCPCCGSTYPRTVGLGEDARCWTCATEDQTGLDEPDRATP